MKQEELVTGGTTEFENSQQEEEGPGTHQTGETNTTDHQETPPNYEDVLFSRCFKMTCKMFYYSKSSKVPFMMKSKPPV